MKKNNNFLAVILVFCLLLAGPATVSALTLNGEASYRPWSGYWWPTWESGLTTGRYYRGHPAPLEKYDLLVSGSYPGEVTRTELANHDPQEAEGWEGYCHAWANAAILERLNFDHAVHGKTFLSIGDQKGILTVCHYDDYKVLEKCRSNPLVFHRYLLDYIGEQGLPVAADLDGGSQVWSYPIYGYQMEISQGNLSDSVSCTIYYADDMGGAVDYRGTIERSKTLSYRLDKDGDGSYTGGEWTNDRDSDNVDFVWEPISQRAENSVIDYQRARALAMQGGDGFPAGGIDRPDHYPLIIPADTQKSVALFCRAGSRLQLRLAVDAQSPTLWCYPEEPVTCQLTRKNGAIIAAGTLTGEESLSLAHDSPVNEELTLSFSAVGNRKDAFVRAYVDMTLANNLYLPGIPNNFYWQGLALANRDGERENTVYLTILGDNGWPLGKVDMPAALNGAANWVGLLPLPLADDYASGGRPDIIRISSAEPVSLLELKGDALTLSGMAFPAGDSSALIIPRLSGMFGNDEKSRLFLYNAGMETVHPQLDYYRSDGSLVGHEAEELVAGQVREYSSGHYPGNVSIDGWARVETTAAGLQGHVLLAENGSRDELPLLKAGSAFYLPHVYQGGGWQTRVVFINSGGQPAAVSLYWVNGADRQRYDCTLAAHERREMVLAPALWGLDEAVFNQGWLEIHAGQPVAGYATYAYNEVSRASLPLLREQELSAEKVVCHVAADGYWWTGLALVNPAVDANEIECIAYDGEGNVLARANRTMEGAEKLVLMADSLFPAAIRSRIRSLRIAAVDSQGSIGGFSLYGTMDGVQLLSALVLR